ncbi:glycerophosphodiester phosphodiesterase [Staphylococcus carnosus]|uniref:glycerophosphodiester phosphodiesterase n=1 Tax=Staphylococcus carnosus TaxID=1281 RepID=UPI0020A2B2FD|nr:glycerophosphodiester phosphodiesterase family protein [Staphylococcus carnosus]UTB80471.1 glycerophosphodiester phosphodiesterase [Staphylococcus carnosus]
MHKIKPDDELKIIAHRGFNIDYPENTLLAYKAALNTNINMLEIDVHLTKDQELVVIHDDRIDRTSNGSDYIKNYTLDELKSYDFGLWKDSTFEGTRIMTFGEVVKLIQPYDITLLIEIKKPSQYPNIEEILLRELKEYRLNPERAILQSFDEKSIQKIAEITREYELGLLLSKKKYLMRMPNFNKIAKFCEYVNPNYQLVNRKFVERAHAHRLKVMPYTVNNVEEIQKLIDLGVDGIITDGPNYYFELD